MSHRAQALTITQPPEQPQGAWLARQGITLRWLALVGASAVMAWVVMAWRDGRPSALPDLPELRLPCVSYAPFHRPGQTPFDPTLRITVAQIEADLRQLQSLTGCVRTYGLDHGLDAVPAVARKLGLRVKLGAWIGSDTSANAQQLDRALALTRDYADVIDLLVVGNEVLLRRELTPSALAQLLARAKRESKVPVAYADVWEFWLRHAAVLREHVDVVAAHVLPYWEDQPVAVHDAVDHVHRVAAQLQSAFAPTPVWIAETGWPAAGRQRGPAAPGRLAQVQFVRALLAREATTPVGFNLIEGFDQPWKRALEGAMGGYWGLFEADGAPRVTLVGAASGNPRWWQVPLGAGLGLVLGGGCGLLAFAAMARRRLKHASSRVRVAPAALVLALASAGTFALLPKQWQLLTTWSNGALDLVLGIGVACITLACAAAAAWRLARHVGDGTSAAVARPGAIDAFAHTRTGAPRLLAVTQLALLFTVACSALGLVFDPRYRSLEWPLLAAPAALLFALACLGDRLDRSAHEERLLAAVCAVAAPALLVQEGLVNAQAWALAALWLLIAWATLWPHRSAPSAGAWPAEGRASTKAASSTAGADKLAA